MDEHIARLERWLIRKREHGIPSTVDKAVNDRRGRRRSAGARQGAPDGPPLLASVAAGVVLLAVALADARRAAGHPPETPSPSGGEPYRHGFTPDGPQIKADVELLYRLADDDDDDVCSEVMNMLRYTSAPLVQHSEMLKRLALSRAFVNHPASLLVVLSNRRDEMPESVLDLCESWAATWVRTAGNISKREAADGYYATDMVLAVYAHATPGGPVRGRCLDLTDKLIEHGVGSAEAKVEHAAYQTIVD